ncbi:hypothetical protein ACFV19_22255 [Streptomyces griseoluteus]|uniref:hypothetical protein n=1 Tax=Streptomyces griseoluteus TaxID=29306 RepID=UPI0036B58DB4
MSIRAIETSYAGHRFRSRLEARWAVFFDSLGMRWEYEPQGYAVGPDGARRPYLPDFFLPEQRLWGEVNGSEQQLDVELVFHAAIPHYGLPNPAGPHVFSEHQVQLLILGPVERVSALVDAKTGEHAGYSQPTHTVLSFRKGDVFQGTASFYATGIDIEPDGGLVGDDGPDIRWNTRGSEWGNWVCGGVLLSEDRDEDVYAGYRAARSARFEHGQTP